MDRLDIGDIEVCYFSELQPYADILQKMRAYSSQRNATTADALWLLQHYPVFTQGQAGKAEHVLDPGAIPVVQSDRGGQVTYHGPGQLVIYTLFDLKRREWGIKQFMHILQESIILLLKRYGVSAHLQHHAPGVYVNNEKICSIGLRVTHGRTYHGLSVNVKMDLFAFSRINPCGLKVKMTQISHFVPDISITQVIDDWLPILQQSISSSSNMLGSPA